MKKRNINLFPFIISALLIFLIARNSFGGTSTISLTYTDVLDKFKTGEVDNYNVDLGSGNLDMRVPRTEFELATYDKKNGTLEEQIVKEQQKQVSAFDFLQKISKEEDEADKVKQQELIVKTVTERRINKSILYKLPSTQIFIDNITPLVFSYNQAHPENPIDVNYIPAGQIPFWVNMLPTLLLFGLAGGLMFFMMRQTGDVGGKGNPMNFGKVKAKQTIDENNRVTFKDVAGADEEKAELSELVEFLKVPEKYDYLGAKIPKGVLLVGPPGTGKTLLARAVAGEAGVPFFSISGSDFVEMFVGVGAKRVRDLFQQAKSSAPSIVFIDEIDAVGRQRGAGVGGGNDEREQTLNQLLVEMDGFGANQGVIIIAATNRRDVLDPALLRPGRFDRQVFVNRPDIEGREDILKVHLRGKPLAPDVNIRTIAKGTVGFTGADLSNVVNEAALLAAKENKKSILQSHFELAIIKVIAGPEKKAKVVSDEDKKLTAYHEAGHAITTFFCPKVNQVHEISIIPRGMAGGYTLSLPEKDESYRLKKQLEQDLIVLLGGRAAESIVLDDISTGASNDIQRVTSLARSMVTQYGFSDVIGPIVYTDSNEEVFLGRDYGSAKTVSDTTFLEIDSEVKKIVFKAFEQSKQILSDNIEKLHLVASVLLEFEKIDGVVFKNLMEGTTSFEELTEKRDIQLALNEAHEQELAKLTKESLETLEALENSENSESFEIADDTKNISGNDNVSTGNENVVENSDSLENNTLLDENENGSL